MLRIGALPAIAALILGACGLTAEQDAPAPSTSGLLENGSVRLSYRLDRPAREGKVPAVVFGHGSGRLTKDSCLHLAPRFRERGFATLCYDKRGVGASNGDYENAGTSNSIRVFDNLASDMAAGVRFLRERSDIDGSRIGLVGASQAGWIIPFVAVRVQPAFMILLVGPTVSVGEEIFYSRLVEFDNTKALADAYAKLPSFDGERGFDPRPTLESLSVPGLWLLGGDDRSIPTPRTVAILDELAARGRPFTRVVFPGADHSLRGAPIWDEIDRWLKTTLK
jgi:pimeloyl-ACP methyl ester carboxylesterase